jgi:plasmid segregation protein ParM
MGIQAIDLGFLYAKAIINGKKIIIKSVVGDSKEQRFGELDMYVKEGEDNIKVNIGNETYFVSDLAINQSDIIHHSLKGNRFNSENTEVLIKAILGISNLIGDDEIIISGLPVSHYTKYRQAIQELFLGSSSKNHNYDVTIDNKSSKGNVKFVDGKFIPQPFGVLLDRVLDEEGQIADRALANKTIAIIDIGFGTTDIYVANALRPIDRMSFSLPRAMSNAYRLIGDKIEEKFGVSLQLHNVEGIAREGAFKSKGETFPIDKLVQWAYKNFALQLVGEINNKWGDSINEIDEIILAGGGGLALSEWILPEFEDYAVINLAEDTQWAVVNGYSKWGKRHYNSVKA